MSKAGTSSNMPPGSVSQHASDFETAIAACGFGCFNICLLITSMTTAISVLFTTSSLSFVLPIAEYDLKLSLMDKGYLNAVSFAGMIVSAIPWGYVADTMGRRVVMMYALILDGIIVMGCGISQTLMQLLVLKFFDGFLICGPFAVIMSYVSEFHGLKHRARTLLVIGMNFSLASSVLPLLGVCILPHHLSITVFNYQINNWHFFLLTTAIVPFVGGILHSFFPESPKFLMSQGRNDEALECMRSIYAINCRKPKSEYPITNLLDEDPVKTQQHLLRNSNEYKATHNTIADKYQEAKGKFMGGLHQLQPMLSAPYLKQSLNIYGLFFCILLGLNSIRLWLPQIFVTIEEFEAKKMGSSNMCVLLNYNYNKSFSLGDVNGATDYELGHININSFIDNLIVALTSFLFYLTSILVINELGSKMILRISLALGFFSGSTLYFSNSRLMILILLSLYIGAICVAASIIVYTSVNLFPTQMRTMVIVLMMTFGRFGSLLGNILFPFLIPIGCIPPFLQIAGSTMVSFILSLFLPNTANLALT